MTRLFDATGAATATTIVEVGPCFVTQIRTLGKDGYEAVQLGFEQVRARKLTSPERGHLKTSGAPEVRVLREVPVTDLDEVTLGDRKLQGRRLVMRPFAHDPQIARFPQFKDKAYEFVVAEGVPGGVYSLASRAPDPKDGHLVLAETVTFQEAMP